jgi:Family of unknown function (DUF5829)
MKRVLSICFLLLSCAPAFSADGTPPVFLSHIWIALDQATYDALRTSKEVAALGAVKEQKVAAGSENWSGFYWTARQTYMEFFGAAALPDETLVGDCGIGMFVETRGGVAVVAERLRTVFGDRIDIDKQVRATATGDIPWYTSTHLKELQTTAMWVMELDPGYLAARHPEAPVRDPLSRQQERSWDFRPDQTLDDVAGLTLALDKEKASELATQLRIFGWSVHRTGSGFFAVGPEVKIRVIPVGVRGGIQQVELRLHRSVPTQVIQLGNAELRLAGKTAQLVLWK